MKKVSKNSKLILTLVLLVLAFCCSLNVTYAYFTASASKSGELNFPDLDVRFVTLDANGDVAQTDEDGEYSQDNLYTIDLYPVGGTISRGSPFQLSLDKYTGVEGETQEVISNLAIQSMPNSAASYVRFWIDAYIVVDDAGNLNTTTNYGKYFLFTIPEGAPFARGGTGTNATESSWCYYLGGPLSSDPSNNTILLGNTLNFSDLTGDAIPADVLGAKLKISITLEAIQFQNGAFATEFNDEKGYFADWR